MQKVSLGYNHQPILKDMNLKVSPGELVGLIREKDIVLEIAEKMGSLPA